MKIPFNEAVGVAKVLFPEWMLSLVQNPGKAAELNAFLEMIGRGFMCSAIWALPSWLRAVWSLKVELSDSTEHDLLIDEVCAIIAPIDDAEKLARQWMWLAVGYTEEEAVLLDIESMREPTQLAGSSGLASFINELENM